MSATDYIVNGILVALVIRQIRGRRLTALNLIWPIALTVWIGTQYLHGIPTSGNDLYLVVGGAVTGLLLGTLCAVFTSVKLGPDGVPFAKAGATAAILWILGVGSRMAFELYSTHGGAKHIASFSVSHHITSAEAWVACLVLMALCEVVGRTLVLGSRAVKLAGLDALTASRQIPRPAEAGAGHDGWQ